MWKNTIRFFHLSGRRDPFIIPVAYQPLEGDVAWHIVTQGARLNLQELIAHLNMFRVLADEDTLTKEL